MIFKESASDCSYKEQSNKKNLNEYAKAKHLFGTCRFPGTR